MRFIGDVHGNIDQYLKLLDCKESVQVGDMGFDYSLIPASSDHKFIMGNHDNYEAGHINCLGDYGLHKDIFFVRGAFSVDKHCRREGIDWFSQEELSYRKMCEAIVWFEKIKPEYVVSHDCPQFLANNLWGYESSATRKMLGAMYEIHQPKVWVFGHHHKSIDQVVGKTRFICLPELHYIDLIIIQ